MEHNPFDPYADQRRRTSVQRADSGRSLLVAGVAAVLIAALGGGIAVGFARADRTSTASAPGPLPSPTTGAPATGTPPTSTPTGTPSATSKGTPAPDPGTPAGTLGPTGSPTSPTGAPGPAAAIPPGAMLSPGDLRRSDPVRVTGSTGVRGLPQTQPNACQARTAYPTDRDRLAARTASYSTPSVPESGGTYETIVRYRPGRAAETLAGMRRVLAACPGGWRTGDWTYRYVLERERFAGDDAILVREQGRLAGTERVWGPHIAVVRLGDHVVTVVTEGGEGVSVAAEAVRLARAATARARCLTTGC